MLGGIFWATGNLMTGKRPNYFEKSLNIQQLTCFIPFKISSNNKVNRHWPRLVILIYFFFARQLVTYET